MKKSVLIVEDEKAIRNFISATLEINDYQYFTAENGKEAILIATSKSPDIIILDLGLPDMDGIEIIEKIRGWSNCPIIVVSARNEDSDKVLALDAGADDYLTKPFSMDELLARIRVAVRKLVLTGRNEAQTTFENGNLKIDYTAGSVSIEGKELHLTPLEYKLLVLLSKNIGKVLTHSYILREVWGTAYESDMLSLRVFMAGLRKKIKKESQQGDQYIQTHVGVGYRMNKF